MCFLLEIPSRDGFDRSELKSELKSGLKSGLISELKGEQKTLRMVLDLIIENPYITIPTMMEKSGKSRTTIQKCIRILKEEKYIEREGSKKGGHWLVLV